MSTLLPHLNDNTTSTLSQATLRLSIPEKYRNDAQNGIKSALLDILERHCEACYESLEDSYNALVRTGLGSDDTFASDMATYLGIKEEEVTLEGYDTAPLETFTIPFEISQERAYEALDAVFQGNVPSGGYTENIAYQLATLDLLDRTCTECGHNL